MTDIRRSKRGGRSVYLNMGIWLNEKTGQIHMTITGSRRFHTTVNNVEGSKRCHANLFKQLTRVLRDQGAPSPQSDI